MKDEAAIVGVGCTRFSDLLEQSYEDMAAMAVASAMHDVALMLGTETPKNRPARGREESEGAFSDADYGRAGTERSTRSVAFWTVRLLSDD